MERKLLALLLATLRARWTSLPESHRSAAAIPFGLDLDAAPAVISLSSPIGCNPRNCCRLQSGGEPVKTGTTASVGRDVHSMGRAPLFAHEHLAPRCGVMICHPSPLPNVGHFTPKQIGDFAVTAGCLR